MSQSALRITFLLLSLFLFDVGLSQAQKSDITTFILIRHAEKVDDSRDPDLSPEGYERAERLADMLSSASIDAIYSTEFTRTEQTVQTVAEDMGLEIKSYSTQDPDSAVLQWQSTHRGDIVVVSGHSNTTPAFANALLGRQHFEANFDESDYGNLLIITVSSNDEASLLHLRY